MLRLLLVIGTTASKVASPLYEPIHVYKPLAPDIGIVDGPLEYLTVGGVRVPIPAAALKRARIVSSNGYLVRVHPDVRKGGPIRYRAGKRTSARESRNEFYPLQRVLR